MSEEKFTKFTIKGRTIFNPSAIDLRATIEVERPCTMDELRELLSEASITPVKDTQ